MITVEAEERTDDLVEAVRFIKEYCGNHEECGPCCRLQCESGACLFHDVAIPKEIRLEDIRDADV